MRAPRPARPSHPLTRATWIVAAVFLGTACGPPIPGMIIGFDALPPDLLAPGGTVSLTWTPDGIVTGTQLAITPSAGVTLASSGKPAPATLDLGTATSLKLVLPKNTTSKALTYKFHLTVQFKSPKATDTGDQTVTVEAPVPNAFGTPGTTAWLTQFGSSGNDHAEAVASGGGGVVVAGYTDGTLGGAPGTGDEAFVAGFEPTVGQTWLTVIGAGRATAVAIDSAGTVYVAGSTTGNLGGTNLGGSDVFLAAYDIGGLQQWIKQFGTAGDDAARGIAVDSLGHLDVTGVFTGGSGAGTGDIFLAQYTTAGTRRWQKTFGATATDAPHGIAVDAAGDIVVAGSTPGNLGGTNKGQGDAFLAKFDVTGTKVWVHQFGTSGDDGASGVAMTPAGQISVAGWAGGDLGGTGSGDLFVAQFDPSGTRTWLTQLGGTGDAANGIAVGPAGDLFVAGATTGSLQGTNAGQTDAFAARYDTTGKQVWVSQLGTSAADAASAVTVDSPGYVLVAGDTGGTLGPSSAGKIDGFLAQLVL